MREEETKGRKKKIGRKEQLGGRNSWEEGTVGRKEQLGGRNIWEEGTYERKETLPPIEDNPAMCSDTG